MIKIKKLLTSLAAIGLVATSASSVVSCVSIKQIRDRKINPSVYKTTFNNSIQNWNIAATMQSADYKILANTQDTLLTYKNDKTLTSQIADYESRNLTDQGLTLKIKDSAKWYNITNGDVVRKITANDIANTAKYTLDIANASEEIDNWTSLINGATKVRTTIANAESDYQDNKITKQQLADIKNETFNKFIVTDSNDKTSDTGLVINAAENKVTFVFKNSSEQSYFESALTTGAFAPIPEEAVQIGYDYGRQTWKNVLVSGPYYVGKFTPSYLLEFKRNKNYDDPNKGTIDTIDYYYSQQTDLASQRRLFETGDVSEALVSQSDAYAMKHYKNFDGLEKVNNNLVGMKYLSYNFSRRHPGKKKATYEVSQADKDSNYALSLNSVRTLISFAMNRSILLKYFAGSDKETDIDNFLTNTYNPAGFLKIDNQEYTDNILDKAGMTGKEVKDAYLGNIKLLDNSGAKNLQDLINIVKQDLAKGGIKGNVTLTFLTSGVNSKTFNPYIRQMINTFDDISNNPIQIIEKPTTDDAEYQTTQIDGDYSMFITGASPSFVDPMSELVDQEINGKMKTYNGIGRLFNQDGKPVDPNVYGINPEFDTELENFSTELNNADAVGDKTTRYQDFANAEYDMLFNYKTVLPLYIPNGKKLSYLTYVESKTRPNVGYGFNDFRLDKVSLAKSIKELIDNKEL